MIKIRLPSHDLWLANHPELKTAQASTSIVMKLIIVIIHHPWSYVEFSNYRLTWYPQQRSSISLVPFTGGSPPFNICCFQNPFLKFEVSSGTQRETYFQNPRTNQTLPKFHKLSKYIRPKAFSSNLPNTCLLVTIEKPPKSMMPLPGGGFSASLAGFFFCQDCACSVKNKKQQHEGNYLA